MVVPLVAALAIGLAGVWRPGLWEDEAVTWSAATRPVDQLMELVQRKDLVLLPYYLFVHYWAEVSTSEWWLRLPSVLAAAGAVGLTAALGRRVYSARAGLLAGLVLAIVPTFSRYAQEARPYALVMLLAVLSSWLLLVALDTGGAGRWALYSLSLVALGLAHLLALLLVLAHGAEVITRTSRSNAPGALGPWLAATLAAAMPLAWLAWHARQQQAALPWTAPGWNALQGLLPGVLGAPGLAFVLVGMLLVGLRARHLSPLVLWWLLAPAALLLLVSQFLPLYNPRYLLFCVPALALLVGAALAEIHPRMAGAVVVILALLAAPTQILLRESDGHSQDFRAAVSAMRDPAAAVVFGTTWMRPGFYYCWRDVGDHPKDVLLAKPLADSPWFGGSELPPQRFATKLARFKRVWFIRKGHPADDFTGLAGPDRQKATVLRRSFRRVQQIRVQGLTLSLYERARQPPPKR